MYIIFHSSMVEQWPFKPGVVGSSPTGIKFIYACTNFFMQFFFSPLEQFSIFQTYTIFFQLKVLDIFFFSIIDLSITVFLIENFNNILVFLILTGFLIRINFLSILKPLPIFLFIQTFLYNIVSQQITDKSI